MSSKRENLNGSPETGVLACRRCGKAMKVPGKLAREEFRERRRSNTSPFREVCVDCITPEEIDDLGSQLIDRLSWAYRGGAQ